MKDMRSDKDKMTLSKDAIDTFFGATRKIIQIATDSQPGSSDWNRWATITALCDDGSIWEYEHTRTDGPKWVMIPAIPCDDDA